jgi:tRNA A37 N6-isopentenylltransferase MiaA
VPRRNPLNKARTHLLQLPKDKEKESRDLNLLFLTSLPKSKLRVSRKKLYKSKNGYFFLISKEKPKLHRRRNHGVENAVFFSLEERRIAEEFYKPRAQAQTQTRTLLFNPVKKHRPVFNL